MQQMKVILKIVWILRRLNKIPNWCNGYVKVKGKPENVENFCKLFIFEDEEGKKEGIYFARSFIHEDWKDFKKNYLGSSEISFNVDFAWSSYSCLIDGYPTAKDNKDCVTLEWACKKYDVEVEIKTEEGGEGFEEKIIANKNGVDYKTFDMPIYECYNCGNKQAIASSYELEDVECYECGEYAFVDKLKKLLEKKIEQENVK